MGRLQEILDSKQAPFGVVVGTTNPVTCSPPKRCERKIRRESEEAEAHKTVELVRAVRNQHIARYERETIFNDAKSEIEFNKNASSDGHKVKFIAAFTPEHGAHLDRIYGRGWERDKAAIRHAAERDPTVAERRRQLEYAADAAR